MSEYLCLKDYPENMVYLDKDSVGDTPLCPYFTYENRISSLSGRDHSTVYFCEHCIKKLQLFD